MRVETAPPLVLYFNFFSLRLHIAFVNFSNDSIASLKEPFENTSRLDISISVYAHDKTHDHNEIQYADFIIYNIASSRKSVTTLPLANVESAKKSFCIFDTECQQSNLLDRLGYAILFEPVTPKKLLEVVEGKLVGINLAGKIIGSPTLDDEYLIFASTDQYVLVEKEKVMYATSSGNYTKLFLDGKKDVTITQQLGKILSKLSKDDFYRVHHSHFINRAFIKSILRQIQLTVVLNNDVKIPVSRRKKKDFLYWLGVN